MGYCGISLNGSDAAAEAWGNASQHFTGNPDLTVRGAAAMACAELRRELSNQHNEWNTPGPVNVALVLTEGRLPLAASREELRSLLQDTVSALEPFRGRKLQASRLIRMLGDELGYLG
jgi:hypothetical protein